MWLGTLVVVIVDRKIATLAAQFAALNQYLNELLTVSLRGKK